jgi:homoserine dehydrogenase
MQTEKQILVLKFGSSVLRCDKDLPKAVREIERWRRIGKQVVAVVSAFGDTTDELTRRAVAVSDQPDSTLFASLLATGETVSSVLLGLALNQAGLAASVLDVFEAGLHTVGPTLDAELVGLDVERLLSSLREKVLVLPGFVGLGENSKTTLLGRGGSDLSALFIAQQLDAHCLLVKDVDGLYTSDPNLGNGYEAARFECVSYTTALRVGSVVVQKKAIEFAQAHRLPFTISSIESQTATEVGPFDDRICESLSLEETEERAA